MNPFRFAEAKHYYTLRKYQFIDVPWLVSDEISDITKPPSLENFNIKDKVLVASAEQSFLQMIRDGQLENDLTKDTTYYQAITPCFRNESVLDDLHKQYFTKLELIILNRITLDDLTHIIYAANGFFNSYIKCKVVNTGGHTYDIVSEKKEIELGSYGIRSHPLVGSWIYGTGLAEPRLTYAMEQEKL